MAARQNKIPRAYRQQPEVVRLIQAAAKELHMSEADIVDLCVIHELGNVLRDELAKPSELPSIIDAADKLKAQQAKTPKEALQHKAARNRKSCEL